MEKLPLFLVRQSLHKEKILSVKNTLRHELTIKGFHRLIRAGERVALTVGSRGIASLEEIVGCLVEWLRECGARPFIVPAMGSHGGANAADQRELLRGYGITEEKIGAPVLSSMEVVLLGYTAAGAPVYMDKVACQADRIIVFNRVKPHTVLSGPVQSGLQKMLAVGLGKQKGAESMHRFGLEKNIPAAASIILQKAPVFLGVAVVENALQELCKIYTLPAEQIITDEPAILEEASKILPVIPFEDLDVLLVRWMGKNISGSGLDTNVVGRWRRVGGAIDKEIKRLAVFDLTPESRGNASGVGMADFITRSLLKKIDFNATKANVMTSGWADGAKIRAVLENEKAVCEQAIKGFDRQELRLVLIESTLNLQEFWVSEKIKEEAVKHPLIEAIAGPFLVNFNAEGKLRLVPTLL